MGNYIQVNILGINALEIALDFFSFMSPTVLAINMALRLLDMTLSLLMLLTASTNEKFVGSTVNFFKTGATTAALWYFVKEASHIANPIWSYFITSAVIQLGAFLLKNTSAAPSHNEASI